MRIKLLLLIFLTIHLTNVFAQKRKLEQEQNKGQIALTFTIINEKPRYSSYSLHYKAKGEVITFWRGKYERISVSPDPLLGRKFYSDYDIEKKKVHLFLNELNSGEYLFFNFNLFRNLGYSQRTYEAKHEFNIPFTVRKDTVTYIGDILYFPRGNENGKIFEWSNQFERDSALFLEKYNLYNSIIIVDVPLDGNFKEKIFFDFK